MLSGKSDSWIAPPLQSKPMADEDGMDALFHTFITEVSNLKPKKLKKIDEECGTSADIIERLTTRKFDSAFQVLQLSPEASESEIAKQYRKLSILIHPDKCKLDSAAEAFQVLVKAYNDTKDPSYKDKYKDIVGEARQRVRTRLERENKKREQQGEDPFETQGNDFDKEVLRECEKMAEEGTEKAEYANKVYEANMKYQEDQVKLAKQARHEQESERKKWEKTRDKRVAGWQVFVNNVEAKRFKSRAWCKVGRLGAADVHHRREIRKDTDMKPEGEGVPLGIDRSYKVTWR